MNSVFIGGSRKVSRLNDLLRPRLDNVIAKDMYVLVGDANGSDKAIQKFFHERGYQHVAIYCSGNECRNNIGQWEEVHVEVERKKKDRVFYGFKDFRMAEDCDYGFMLWDGESSGTMSNVVNILTKGKHCMLYLSPKKTFTFLKDFSDLEPVLRELPPFVINELDRKVDLRDRLDGLIAGSQIHLGIG